MVTLSAAVVDILISVASDISCKALWPSARWAGISVAAPGLVFFQMIFIVHILRKFAEMTANLLIASIYRRISKLAIASFSVGLDKWQIQLIAISSFISSFISDENIIV